MLPCHAPDLSRLPSRLRPVFAAQLQALQDQHFDGARLRPQVPALAAQLCDQDPDDTELQAWADELQAWVRWYRVPSTWLAFIFQAATQLRGSAAHVRACCLYAETQVHWADDLALSSLENAYRVALRNGLQAQQQAVQARLQRTLLHLSTWARPFALRSCNPLADHLALQQARDGLLQLLSDEDPRPDLGDADMLADVAARAQGDAHRWTRVQALRLLALQLGSQGRFADSVAPLQQALQLAIDTRMDTEIGHLHRQLGLALRQAGRLADARQQFEQALAFERLQPFRPLSAYWQALSARELGDVLLRLTGPRATVQGHDQVQVQPDQLTPALQAYRAGRQALARHLALQSPYPLARAGKQQAFRSYAANALQAAALGGSTPDLLAEAEAAGPREATAVVAEMAAAQRLGQADPERFRRDRALSFESLNTVPPTFQQYLAGVVAHAADQRAYLLRALAMAGTLAPLQDPDLIVQRTLALRLPATVFAIVHLDATQGLLVLLDMASGLAAPYVLPFGAEQAGRLHDRYEAARRAATDAAGRRQALDQWLQQMQALLAPVLQPLLPFLRGQHLKVFPRLQLNALPWHALRFDQRHLVEHAGTVSQGQTLGLFLANHEAPARPCEAALRVVLGDQVPWYRLLVPGLQARLGAALQLHDQPPWPQLREQLAARPARDTVLACHGRFDAQQVTASRLQLSAAAHHGSVSFADLFSQLDLQGCRSVVMGSCESGLSRAELASEYIGLPAAMLASGVRYVVGALWTVPQAATAVLVDRLLQALPGDDGSVAQAFSEVQRQVMRLSRDELAHWVGRQLQGHAGRAAALQDVAAMDERPFAHPYQWAGLQVVGDV